MDQTEKGLWELEFYLKSLLDLSDSNENSELKEIKKYKYSGISILYHPSLPFVLFYYPLTYTGQRMAMNEFSENVCIHLDEDLWIKNPEIIRSRLNNRCGINKVVFARKTIVAKIDKKIAMQFLNEHHLLGALPGKYRFGLFLYGELISVAVFSKGIKMKNIGDDYKSFELLRFCHKTGIHIPGGLSKLLKKFSVEVQANDIMTYVDLDWKQGDGYENLDFVTVSETGPLSYFLNPDTLERISSKKEDIETKQFLIKFNSGSLKCVKRV